MCREKSLSTRPPCWPCILFALQSDKGPLGGGVRKSPSCTDTGSKGRRGCVGGGGGGSGGGDGEVVAEVVGVVGMVVGVVVVLKVGC